MSQNQSLPKVEDKTDSNAKVEIPFTAYEKIKGSPYTVEHFNITEWKLLDDQTDINKTRDKVYTIEDFVKSEIRQKNLKNTTDSYKEIINKYKSELHISENEKDTAKLERVYLYIKLIQKQRKLDERRTEIIQGLKGAK